MAVTETAHDPCPLCDRPLVPGPSVNEHHLIPKCEGGKDAHPIHRICHSKIHSIWSENELRDVYNTFEAIRADERIQKFVRWVSKKAPEYRSRNRMANDHRKRRRR